MSLEDQLQDRLARLENGEALGTCTAQLPADEAELLTMAVSLRAITYPAQGAESIAAQRASLLAAAAARRDAAVLPAKLLHFLYREGTMLATWPKSVKFAALGAAIVAILIGLFAMRSAVPTTVPLNQSAGRYLQYVPLVSSIPNLTVSNPREAVLTEARGLVELQTANGQWTPIRPGQVLNAGQHIRTKDLSSGTLLFYDGSQTKLGALTEIAIEQLDAPTSGPRTILLAQLSGSTDHDVAHSSDPASRYEVHTPNGTGSAKGTIFHVFLTPALVTRIAVDEGTVVVVNVNITVQVTAGQVTTIGTGAPPSSPAFQVTGEGIVTQMGEVWRIGGLDFHTTNNTVVVGNPQLGDRVSVDGHLAPDGTRIADVIVLLSRASQNRFEFTGPVEAIGSDHWTIAGRTVEVSQTTHIDNGIKVGDLVKTDGVISSNGTLLAENIRLLTTAGLPFEFTGLVQQIGAASWTISGISVAVTGTTEIDDHLAVGDVVKVEGHILPDGVWLADKIQRADDEREFEFTGIVQSINPWKVSGIVFSTTEQTVIDAGIKPGDRVRVDGHILPNGTWVAEEIKLLDLQPLTFEFVGQVTSMNPWIVSGISFTVNSSTTIESGIQVGSLVRVSGVVQPDGTLLAHRIELVDEELGCTDTTVVVVRINGNQITLSNGQTITLTPDVTVVGQLQGSAIVIVRLCVRTDGTLVIISIIVIFTPSLPPVVVPPPPSSGGQVTICHYPGGNKRKGHTISVGQSAVAAHLAHGDKLGPCGNGGQGNDGENEDD